MNKSLIIFDCCIFHIFANKQNEPKKNTKKILQNAKSYPLSIASYCCAFGHSILALDNNVCAHTKCRFVHFLIYLFFYFIFFSFQWLIIIIGKLTLITVSLTLVYRACEIIIITQLNLKSDIFK